MVMDKGVSFKNTFRGFVIENGRITESHEGTIKKFQAYNGKIDPLNQDYFFRTFIALNPDNESEILDFYNKYGSLGLWYEGAGVYIGPTEQLTHVQFEIKLMKLIVDIRNALSDGSIKTIVCICNKLFSMREFNNRDNNVNNSIVDLMYCSRIDDSDVYYFTSFISEYEYLSRNITEESNQLETAANNTIDALRQHFEPRALDDEYFDIRDDIIQNHDFNTIHFVAGILFEKIMNSYLKDVKPILIYDSDCNGQWSCPTLLISMYFELYLAFCSNKIIKKCKNRSCPEYFLIYGHDVRKEYCDNKCAKLEWQRKNRASKKAKEADSNGKH